MYIAAQGREGSSEGAAAVARYAAMISHRTGTLWWSEGGGGGGGGGAREALPSARTNRVPSKQSSMANGPCSPSSRGLHSSTSQLNLSRV